MLSAPAPAPSKLPLIAIGLSVLALGAAVGLETAPRQIAGLVVIVAFLAAGYRVLTRWHALVGAIGLVIFFIPIKRYEFRGVSLPLDLEPYRVAVGIVIVLWISSLLIDRRVTLRASGLEPPLLLFGLAVLGSIATNFDRIAALDLSGNVTKQLLFLASFYFVFYFVVSVVREPATIHRVIEILVLGATVVAFFSLIERRTGYNVFNHIHSAFPFLEFRGALDESGSIARAGRLRTYASAQHPIALAGMFVMMLPLALYLAHYTKRRIWAAASVVIVFASLATVSRTSITMLAAVTVVFLTLRPRAVKRIVPLILPALIVVHLALPGVIGGIRQAFFPPQGLIADQTEYGGRFSERRLAPQFAIIRAQPGFGQGYGTRIVTSSVDRDAVRLPEQQTFKKNAQILDNEWLGTTVETGLAGFIAWLWLFGRFVRRAGRGARRDVSPRGWLLAALASSMAAAGIGMISYDTFSFIQVTFVIYIVAALGACTLAYDGPWPKAMRQQWGPDKEPRPTH